MLSPILDWALPEVNGEALYRALAEDSRLEDIPILVLTGDPRSLNEARALGVQHVALKPIDPDALLEIVGGHCASRGSTE